MNRVSAVIALLFLLCLPLVVHADSRSSTGDGTGAPNYSSSADANNNGIPDELEADLPSDSSSSSDSGSGSINGIPQSYINMYGDKAAAAYHADHPESNTTKSQTDNSTSTDNSSSIDSGSNSDSGNSYWGSLDPVKAMQTAVENALSGYAFTIIDQLMKGSVDIYEVNSDNNTDGTVTFSMNTKLIYPLAPDFVLQTLLDTGGLYLITVIFVMGGSYLLLVGQDLAPEQFSAFREATLGEEKPYNIGIVKVASILAMLYPLLVVIYIFIVTGTRNLVIFTASPTKVVLPDLVSNSIPTALLTGLSAYSSALQSATGEYGIYIITALAFIMGIVTAILLMLGAIRIAVSLNVVVWGLYLLFNCVDIINVCAVSAGISVYLYTDNPIDLTVGILAGGFLNFVILAIIVVYAIYRGRKSFIGV